MWCHLQDASKLRNLAENVEMGLSTVGKVGGDRDRYEDRAAFFQSIVQYGMFVRQSLWYLPGESISVVHCPLEGQKERRGREPHCSFGVLQR